jgi:hypothetical protein
MAAPRKTAKKAARHGRKAVTHTRAAVKESRTAARQARTALRQVRGEAAKTVKAVKKTLTSQGRPARVAAAVTGVVATAAAVGVAIAKRRKPRSRLFR